MENSAEQGGGRRNPDGFRGRQRSYAEFYTTDVKGFYLRIVLNSINMITAFFKYLNIEYQAIQYKYFTYLRFRFIIEI